MTEHTDQVAAIVNMLVGQHELPTRLETLTIEYFLKVLPLAEVEQAARVGRWDRDRRRAFEHFCHSAMRQLLQREGAR